MNLFQGINVSLSHQREAILYLGFIPRCFQHRFAEALSLETDKKKFFLDRIREKLDADGEGAVPWYVQDSLNFVERTSEYNPTPATHAILIEVKACNCNRSSKYNPTPSKYNPPPRPTLVSPRPFFRLQENLR